MPYIAYYRVSTKRQGLSGLGLEAQKEQVLRFLPHGERILNEFLEIESGKKDDRPQLALAIAEAKNTGSKLVIAKLDRLSRNAGFIFTLRDSGVSFVCADMPEANTLTIGIMAVLAQDERERISQRTKAALQAKKARGEKLGNPENLTSDARDKGLKARKRNARVNEANVQATELCIAYRNSGNTLQEVAEKLNAIGMLTRYGKQFKPMSVKRLLDRANNEGTQMDMLCNETA